MNWTECAACDELLARKKAALRALGQCPVWQRRKPFLQEIRDAQQAYLDHLNDVHVTDFWQQREVTNR